MKRVLRQIAVWILPAGLAVLTYANMRAFADCPLWLAVSGAAVVFVIGIASGSLLFNSMEKTK